MGFSAIGRVLVIPVAAAFGGRRRAHQLDPRAGRNRYRTRTIPSGSEISFASTTASNVSSRGLRLPTAVSCEASVRCRWIACRRDGPMVR